MPSEILPDCPSSTASALDAQALERLRELDPEGQAGIVVRVLTAYDRSLQDALPTFREARDAGDLDSLRRVAHTLKSASASVGALEFARLCVQVEAAARAGDNAGMPALTECFEHEARRVLLELEAILSS